MSSIVIVDIDSGIDLDEITKAAAALSKQVIDHFAPCWNVFAAVSAATVADPLVALEWRLELRKVPTMQGALGFHSEQDDGTPVLYVFPELCTEEGTTWTSCASHEILEALADPYLRRCIQMDDGSIWDCEVCDRVEADTYEIDGVTVSNFNTPACFEPPRNLKGVKFDYLGLSTKPNEVRPGGYAQTFAPGHGWQQVGAMRVYRQGVADIGLSRGSRRRAR